MVCWPLKFVQIEATPHPMAHADRIKTDDDQQEMVTTRRGDHHDGASDDGRRR